MRISHPISLIKQLVVVLLLVLVIPTQASLWRTDSIPQYDFIRYDLNRLSVLDSTTLSPFFEKLYTFDTENKGKINILQIGDSHIQAGFLSGKIRESLHHGFGCGTSARGFLFPFAMAKTNGPVNYAIRSTGKWTSYRSASNRHSADWGVSGMTTITKDDTTTLKIYTKNIGFDNYWIKQFRIYYKDDSSAFRLSIKGHNQDSLSVVKDSLGCHNTYVFNKETDTIYVTIIKDSLYPDAQFEFQGIELLNNRPGITYSEIGMNGAKVKSYLRCQDFNSQLGAIHPDLIILSLGTNDGYDLNFKDSIFEHRYDSLIRIIKAELPYASIILTTPGDCKRYRKKTIRENLEIRKTIFSLGKKYNCGVWDFFNVMGGLTSMDKWVKNKLAARDYIHFNQKGYELQGILFYEALRESYAAYTQTKSKSPVILNEGMDIDKFINNIFFYNPKEPLIFSNYLFWIFFTVFFIIYSLIYKNFKARSLYLFLFSLFFYYKAGGFYFFLLIFSTIVDFWIGNKIFKTKVKGNKKVWLWLSISVNLLLLFFFKYSYFLTDTINYISGWELKPYNVFSALGNLYQDGHFNLHEIILPVGISFYTFQTISYSIDIYRERIEPVKSLTDFGFFVSFFPQLVAGPIVRANEFIPQINKPYSLTVQDVSRASLLIVGGLFKKLVISDYISINFVDRVFESPLKYSGFENLMGSYGYAIQIYCDFSAYSDIAIGLALFLGFTLPENFRAPYLSKNITDFWRRWHMSLSRWLKDYLYISLGGNRKGKLRTYVNLFITMLLGGLWHGAALKFIIWGGMHGVALAIHKFFSSLFPKLNSSKNIAVNFFSWAITFHFVVFCWVFFRASDLTIVKHMLNQIAFKFDFAHIPEYVLNPGYLTIFPIILLGYLLHLVPEKLELSIQKIFSNSYWPSVGVLAISMVLLMYQFKSSEIQPFIYFQF